MPYTKSGWLIPTGEVVYLDSMSHSEVVQKFLSGLFLVNKRLAKYCRKDLKRFLKRETYQEIHLSEAIEDYAVLCLRWIKIGNAYGFYNNNTITIADYDGNRDKIKHYEDIGYQVNVIPVFIHCYETIVDKEYREINIPEVIQKGNVLMTLSDLEEDKE